MIGWSRVKCKSHGGTASLPNPLMNPCPTHWRKVKQTQPMYFITNIFQIMQAVRKTHLKADNGERSYPQMV